MSALIPGGSQTLSKQQGRFPGAYPRSLVYGRGVEVHGDEPAHTRRWYIDWIAGLGAISLGYHDRAIDAAVMEQVEDGPIFSLPNVALEERVAQRLVDLIPCAESVRFVKTGSECTEAAIRVARAATGREIILCVRGQYHGWHSWHAATREECPGVPLAMKGLVRQFGYNDLASLDNLINGPSNVPRYDTFPHPRLATHIAAIILEPTLIEPPAPGFLEGVRERATKIGAVLIFDEMVTGFRWHAGGYQALCGVTPDLATFGKGMSNGYPQAALVGRADIMRHAMLVSGTFGGDCIGLAAADATLARYQQGGVCEHMWRIGQALMDGYNALAEKHGVPTRAVGQAPHPVIRWNEQAAKDYSDDAGAYRETTNRHRASLFFQETVKRGILLGPDGNNVMLAHADEDVATTLRACAEAMEIVRGAITAGTVREQIQGEPIDPRPAWRVVR